MKRDSLTQQHLKKYPEKISRFNKVVIWSGEWKAYWGPSCSGYTRDILKAGIYDAEEALNSVLHCGPEKEISIISAPSNLVNRNPGHEEYVKWIEELVMKYGVELDQYAWSEIKKCIHFSDTTNIAESE